MRAKWRVIGGVLLLAILVCGAVGLATTTTTLTMPDNVYRPAEFVVSSTTTNSGTAYTNVKFIITVDGPEDFTGDRANTFTVTKVHGSSEPPVMQGINDTFELAGGDWVGYWGPATGFPLAAPYSATTPMTIQMCNTGTAPLGDYDITVALVDLTPEPDEQLSEATGTLTLSADTLYVGTGQQFTTIQDAINAANAGDTIYVAAGTYKEHITIDKSGLNLLGEDKATTIIDATQDPSWPVAKSGILIGEYPLVDGVQGVTVSGFTIQDAAMQEGGVPYAGERYGVGPGGLGGVQIYNSSNNIIEDNILINNYWQIWLVAEWYSAGYTECRNNRIANNVIQNSENDGVYLYSDGGVYIENTEIANNEISNAYGTFASGVEFWGWPEGGPTPTIIGTVIGGNDIASCTYGVRIRDDVSDITGTLVNFNNFIGNTNYGIYNGVTSSLDAKHNYWGDASGPSGGVADPVTATLANGSGDKVSEHVLFDPWTGMSTVNVVVDPDVKEGDDPVVNPDAGVSVTIGSGTGSTAVTIAEYTSPPPDTPSFGAGATYVDVQLSDPGNVNELTITFENMDPGTVIYFYLPGTGWIACSNQTQVGGTIRVTVTNSTVPTLAQLTGTVFAEGTALGNVNGDSMIDVLDVRLCLQIATGSIEGTGAQRASADVDGDGDVDLTDARILAEYIIGIRTTLPGGGSS